MNKYILNIFKQNKEINLELNCLKNIVKNINYKIIKGYFVHKKPLVLDEKYKYYIYYNIEKNKINIVDSLIENNNKRQLLFLCNEKIHENHLEVGDILPFIKFNDFEIVTIFNKKPILFLLLNNKNYNFEDIENYNIITINKESNDYDLIHQLFNFPSENNKYILLNTNFKIINIDYFNDELIIKNINQQISVNYTPYILLDNVLNDSLINQIIEFYNNNKLIKHKTIHKSRNHVFPNKELELLIDNKLSRTILPELKKIFHLDVNYRELYKICCYDSKFKGKFDTHRDSVPPHNYRKYAISLFLNDNTEYEGGTFEFPEYNLTLKPKKNQALIFPCLLAHRVNEVTKGNRKVIITFLSDNLNKFKHNNNYIFKSNYFNNIEMNNVYN